VIRIKGTSSTGGGNNSVSRQDGTSDDEANILTKWLARIRGPEAKDGPLRVFPRPRGAATRVVITEYQLLKSCLLFTMCKAIRRGTCGLAVTKPKPLANWIPHGNREGVHDSADARRDARDSRVKVDKNDTVWFSENWGHNLNKLDPQTGKVTQAHIEDAVPVNAPGFGNFAMTPDGFVWDSRDNNVRKIDPETGKVLQRYPSR